MIKMLKTDAEVISGLLERDELFTKVIELVGDLEIELSTDYFDSLANSIVNQQLSLKSAAAIWSRMQTFLNGEVNPDSVLAADDIDLRNLGISYPKIRYLKNIALAALQNSLKMSDFDGMEDADIIKNLTAIKGIGVWTAEMFLIFTMGRRDVFALGDRGLQRAVKHLYGFKEPVSANELLGISKKWSPYRTFASLYLWEILDKKYTYLSFS